MLSEAAADRVIVPSVTESPFVGELIETCGDSEASLDIDPATENSMG